MRTASFRGLGRGDWNFGGDEEVEGWREREAVMASSSWRWKARSRSEAKSSAVVRWRRCSAATVQSVESSGGGFDVDIFYRSRVVRCSVCNFFV